MSRKDRFIDVALVLGCLVLTALAVKGSWSSLPWPAAVAAGVVGSAAQGVRRRWPLVAAIAGTAAYPISGNPGPWLVGLYSGAVYARSLLIPVVAVAGWAGFAAWSWLDEGQLQTTDAAYSLIAAGAVVAA